MKTMNLNLLPSGAKFQASKMRLQKQIRLIMMFLLGGWIVTVVGVFLLNTVVKMRTDIATKKDKSASANYVVMADNILINQDLKHKAKLVAGVLDGRFEYGSSFETIQNLFDVGIELDKYELGEDGTFKVEGLIMSGENVDKLEQVIEEVNMGEREGLSSAKLLGLSIKNGIWRFTMEVSLK